MSSNIDWSCSSTHSLVDVKIIHMGVVATKERPIPLRFPAIHDFEPFVHCGLGWEGEVSGTTTSSELALKSAGGCLSLCGNTFDYSHRA